MASFSFTNTNVMYAQKEHFKIDVVLITVFPVQHAAKCSVFVGIISHHPNPQKSCFENYIIRLINERELYSTIRDGWKMLSWV